MMKPIHAAPVAAALLLAGCGADAPGQGATVADHSPMDHSGHDMGAASGAPLSEAQAAYKAANDRMHAGMAEIPADPDVAFMQGMLAHHQGALEMSQVALKYAKDGKVRALAQRIIAAQQAEIAEMQAWLSERGAK